MKVSHGHEDLTKQRKRTIRVRFVHFFHGMVEVVDGAPLIHDEMLQRLLKIYIVVAAVENRKIH